MKKFLAVAGAALALIGAGLVVPSAANAADSTDGLNTCKVTYTYEYGPNYMGKVWCAFNPGYAGCSKILVKHVTCTRY